MNMVWVCELCKTEKEGTGTMVDGKKSCTECFQKSLEKGEWVRSKTRNWGDQKTGQRIAGKVLELFSDGTIQVSKYRLAADDWERIEPPADIQPYSSNIVNVAHYSGWDVDVFIETQQLNFRLGNVIKYVARAGKKDAEKDIEDLEKARAYLSREILRRRQKKGLPDETEKK